MSEVDVRELYRLTLERLNITAAACAIARADLKMCAEVLTTLQGAASEVVNPKMSATPEGHALVKAIYAAGAALARPGVGG